jgi:hypothetical protein
MAGHECGGPMSGLTAKLLSRARHVASRLWPNTHCSPNVSTQWQNPLPAKRCNKWTDPHGNDQAARQFAGPDDVRMFGNVSNNNNGQAEQRMERSSRKCQAARQFAKLDDFRMLGKHNNNSNGKAERQMASSLRQRSSDTALRKSQ